LDLVPKEKEETNWETAENNSLGKLYLLTTAPRHSWKTNYSKRTVTTNLKKV